MLVNKDLKESAKFTIELTNKNAKIVRISAASGKEAELGGEASWQTPGARVLVRIEQ